MSKAVGFYREAWLVVAQGGWWKPIEIMEQIPSGIEVNDPHNSLWSMARRHGYLITRGERGATEYAINAQCKTPQGLTVGQLNRALIGRQNDNHRSAA